MKTYSVLVALLLASSVLRSWAISGELDLSFDPGSSLDRDVRAILVLSDAKVLIGGEFTTVHGAMRGGIARLHADGQTDTGFLNDLAGARGPNGGGVDCMIMQSDGRILIGGTFTNVNGVARNRIARLQPDGSLDSTFMVGVDGANGRVQAMTLQGDGKIVVGGWFTSVNGIGRTNLARLNHDGSVDSTFLGAAAGLGGSYHAVFALAVQADQSVLVGGWFSSINGVAQTNIARLDVSGDVDTSFRPAINVDSLARVVSVVVQPDGQILISGDFIKVNGVECRRIARLHPDGSLDTGFKPVTEPSSSPADLLAIQEDEKILVGGSHGITRLNADGSRDETFPRDYLGVSQVYAAALQSNHKIVIGGSFTAVNDVGRRGLARLNADGTFDSNFDNGPAGPNQGVLCALAQPDGKFVIGGSFFSVRGTKQPYVARLNPNGTVDTSFYSAAQDYVVALGRQSDGRLLLGHTQHGPGRLYRLYSDGSLDTTFQSPELRTWIWPPDPPDPGWPPYSAPGWVASMFVFPDDRILISGEFEIAGQPCCTNVALLSKDGTVIGRFFPPETVPSLLRMQPDGKVLAAVSTLSGGASEQTIWRYGQDGMPDSSFNPPRLRGSDYGLLVSSIDLERDGSIVVAGQFVTVNDIACTNLAKLKPDGALDMTFHNPLSEFPEVQGMVVQADDKIVIVGTFTVVDGASASGIARLNPDGRRDLSFAPGGFSEYVYDLTCLLDLFGRLMLTGGFSSVNGIPRERVARMLLGDRMPSLENSRLENGQFGFDLYGEPGNTLVLETSTDLQFWAPLSTNTMQQVPTPYCDRVNPVSGERYYRMRTP